MSLRLLLAGLSVAWAQESLIKLPIRRRTRDGKDVPRPVND